MAMLVCVFIDRMLLREHRPSEEAVFYTNYKIYEVSQVTVRAQEILNSNWVYVFEDIFI